MSTKAANFGLVAGRIFDALWLPLFLIIGMSWLLAPAFAHEHYGILKLISVEEAEQYGFAGLFRLCDVVAALILLAAALRYRVIARTKHIGLMLVAAAVLSVIDGLFPDTCFVTNIGCGTSASIFSAIHDVETSLLAVLLLAMVAYDAWLGRQKVSAYFLGLQGVMGALVVSSVVSLQATIALQYAYQMTMVLWLGWFTSRFARQPNMPGSDVFIRRAIGGWAILSGALSILASIPRLHFIHHPPEFVYLLQNGTLLEQHGVIAGVLMLYGGRHLLKGEHRAMWLVMVLFISQVLKFSIFTPQPALLTINLVALVLLIYARHSFDRNIEPPKFISRLQDSAAVIAGVTLAVVSALVIAAATGHSRSLYRDIQHLYSTPYHRITGREDRLPDSQEDRFRAVVNSLLISAGIMVLWSLFRPARLVPKGEQSRSLSRRKMEKLLHRHATSSEDFFKIWPPDKEYFWGAGSGGAIAYRVVGGVAYALADPIATSKRRREQTLQNFTRYIRQQGWTACWLVVPETSKDMYAAMGLKNIRIGSSAVIDIERFCSETSRSKWWRWQRNRATRNGWKYAALTPPHSTALLDELQALSSKWLGHGGRVEQGFALGYFDRDYLQSCVLHVLRDNRGNVIAFTNEIPIYNHLPQRSVDMLRYLPHMDGAMPALLQHVIESSDRKRYRTFDLGFVPLAGLDNNMAKIARRLGASRFSAGGLEQFKNKFRPDWQEYYLAYDGDLIDLARIVANLERLFAVTIIDSAEQQKRVA